METKKENRLVTWVENEYPMLNLNTCAQDVTALVKEVLELRKENEKLKEPQPVIIDSPSNFNLSEAQAGRAVETKKGIPVKLVSFDPVVGILDVEGRTHALVFNRFGDFEDATEYDLQFKPMLFESWVNLYTGEAPHIIYHANKENAMTHAAHPSLIKAAVHIKIRI